MAWHPVYPHSKQKLGPQTSAGSFLLEGHTQEPRCPSAQAWTERGHGYRSPPLALRFRLLPSGSADSLTWRSLRHGT